MTNVDIVFLAGDHKRLGGPARVIIPVGIDKPMTVKITGEINEDKEVELFGYIEPLNKKESELFTILPPLDAKDELETSLELKNVETEENIGVEKVSDNQIQIKIKGKEFTNFFWNNQDKINRPCLYPLIAPCGTGASRNYPLKEVEGEKTDHIHHASCWTAYGDLNGEDNWAYGKKKARQEVLNIEFSGNPVLAKINADIDWVSKKGKIQLKEKRQIWIYNLEGDRVIDFKIALTAVEKDIKFGDTKEGGFLSVRVATPMDVPRGGKIENNWGGVNEEETWGKQAAWCDYSGIVDRNKVGLAIFDNKDNLRFPTYWHVRDYGLMAANPLALSYYINKKHDGTIVLQKGEDLVFKYRLIVHDGDASDAKLKEQYLNYHIPWKTAVFKS